MTLRPPGVLQDALSSVFSRFNRIAYRSSPGGAPQARAADSWSFAAIGDFGAGTQSQLDVARNVLRGAQSLVLTLGDSVYESGLESEYRKHFDPPERFGDILRRFPVYPTVGNHDVKGGGVEPYMRRFPLAKGRRQYTFEHRDVRFFSLDSTQPLRPGTPQWSWLEGALAQAWDGWKVVYMHHPLRSSQHDRDRPEDAQLLGELLGRHGVSLLLTGHDHVYERSKPLNEFGTVQIVAGNGGRMLYPFRSSQASWSAYREVAHGHVDVEVRGDALVVRHVRRDGVVTDTHAIARRAKPAPG